MPVIIEKDKNAKGLGDFEGKTIVPRNSTASNVFLLIKKSLKLQDSQALFLIAGGKFQITAEMIMDDVYNKYKDEDGFLYFTYSAAEVFG